MHTKRISVYSVFNFLNMVIRCKYIYEEHRISIYMLCVYTYLYYPFTSSTIYVAPAFLTVRYLTVPICGLMP